MATPGSEAKLLEFARAGSAAKLEQMVRMWKKLSRDAELTAEQARHHRAVHEGRVKVSVAADGTVLFLTRTGTMLADAPRQRSRANSGQRSRPALPPVPSVHPGAPPTGERAVLSNGAALHRDSAIPWAIEVAAREALDELLEPDP